MSSYEEFLNTVEKTVAQLMGDEYVIQQKAVLKNNGIVLNGLIIRKEGENIVPSIYLNEYYIQHQNGSEIEDICHEIIDVYQGLKENSKEQFTEIHYTYEEMKNCIIYRLVNLEKNKELLSGIPYKKIMDFAMTFHCLVRNDEDGIGTIRITDEHCKQWGVTTEKLYQQAMINTPILFPATIKRMEEVMFDLMKKEMLGGNLEPVTRKTASGSISEERTTRKELEEKAEQAANELLQLLYQEVPKNPVEMYVLSNQLGINGASCMLYPEVLQEFADEREKDFFILPSSIHEIIMVPYEKYLGARELKEMVMEINQTQVPTEDILSDEVYWYSREKNQVQSISMVREAVG